MVRTIGAKGILMAGLLAAYLHPFPCSSAGSDSETRKETEEVKFQTHFGKPVTDREAWGRLAKLPSSIAIVKEAGKLAEAPLPETSDELYLEFSRTGDREKWQKVNFSRRSRLRAFTLAECFEDKGRFLKPLEEALRSICAERTWLMPAHDRDLRNFRGEITEIDLGSAMLGFTMGEIFNSMGGRLSPEIREMVRENVMRRVVSPYRAMLEGRQKKDWWLTCTNNWNAVCLCGSTGAALSFAESQEDRDLFVKGACDHIGYFLSGFAKDGYCSEGYGYWGYGFSHFAILSELLMKATDGRVDLLRMPEARGPALYGVKAEISNGICPSFADCDVDQRTLPRLQAHINSRLGLGLPQCAGYQLNNPDQGRDLYRDMMYSFTDFPEGKASSPAWEPELRTWFPDAGILICRPDRTMKGDFAAALKGGHNDEHHNHNDVGSYEVLAGNFSILCDPGAEVYTARTFSKDRYKSNVLNSYGHPVPLVDGELQRTGKEARGVPLSADFSDGRDTVSFDISSAYGVKGLKRLVRTFEFSREGKGSFTVTDEFEFDSPKPFETALMTFGKAELSDSKTILVSDRGRRLKAEIDADGQEFSVPFEEIKEDMKAKKFPLRIGIRLVRNASKGSIKLRISLVD